MVKVLVVEDHHLVRQGIIALIEKSGEMQIVGEAADGFEALSKIKELKPEVVIMDIAMPNLNGVQTIEQLKRQGINTKVVVLSMYSDPATIRQALKKGAKGYLLKRSVTEELLAAIRAAAQDEIHLSPSIAEIINSVTSMDASENEIEELTDREHEVLKLIVDGHTNGAIGYILNISIKTVEKHRASIMTKLHVHDTASLVRVAIRNGFVA
jgi:DNA-binding NarL/FixJ family response regulator